MNLSIVIPNYNGENFIERNLQAVLVACRQYKDGGVEIVISDDHSSDNSLEIINVFIQRNSTSFLPIKLVHNPNIKGFACNVDFAVQQTAGEIIILLNTDTIPDKNFINPLLKHFQNEKVFAVGCAEETKEKGKEVIYGRAIGSFNKGFVMHKAGDFNHTKTFWVSCGSGAFRKSVWDSLHGLDEIYNPFYWEDIDLSYRAVKSGLLLFFEKDSRVDHYHEEGAIKSNFNDKKIKTIAYRNQFIFIWKNITDNTFLIQHILWLPYHFIKALLRYDLAFLRGFFSAVLLLPKVIQSRNVAKKRFILTDKEVLLKQK